MKPLVSVIMPVYNAEKTIEIAIESILNQTYRNIELIICDDGSTDNSIKLINNFQDDRIKLLINKENRGNLFTTNKLFSFCKGDFIALQDSDDYSDIYRLEKQIHKIHEEKVDLVSSSAGLIYNNKNIREINNPKYPNQFMNTAQVPILWGACLFKREIYDCIGGFDPIFNRIGAADYNWLQRASFKFKFYNLEDVLYFYRQHGDSFTKKTEDVNILKFYSEDISFDIYKYFLIEGKDYSFDLSKHIFEERSVFYKEIFAKDNYKMLSVIYNKFIFNKINIFSFVFEILKVKSKFKNKVKYILKGILYKFIGFKFFEKIKGLLR